MVSNDIVSRRGHCPQRLRLFGSEALSDARGLERDPGESSGEDQVKFVSPRYCVALYFPITEGRVKTGYKTKLA